MAQKTFIVIAAIACLLCTGTVISPTAAEPVQTGTGTPPLVQAQSCSLLAAQPSPAHPGVWQMGNATLATLNEFRVGGRMRWAGKIRI